MVYFSTKILSPRGDTLRLQDASRGTTSVCANEVKFIRWTSFFSVEETLLRKTGTREASVYSVFKSRSRRSRRERRVRKTCRNVFGTRSLARNSQSSR